jgi:hypothetical protein
MSKVLRQLSELEELLIGTHAVPVLKREELGGTKKRVEHKAVQDSVERGASTEQDPSSPENGHSIHR